MKKLSDGISWFKGLAVAWQIALVVGVLIAAFWIVGMFTGWTNSVGDWWFDRKQAQHEQVIKDLEAERTKIRAEIELLKKENIELKTDLAVEQATEKKSRQEEQQVKDKLSRDLAELDKEEAITAQPIDAYTRCQRTNDKLKGRGIQLLDCEAYK